MFKNFILLAFALFSCTLLNAQTCATPFTTASSALNEVCDTTGADLYAITVTASSDSTLTFVGLYRELTPINAYIDCLTDTFAIAPQHLFTGHYVVGSGYLASPNVYIRYTTYRESDSTLSESCGGYYAGNAVGTASPLTHGLYVYPNPASGSVNVRLDADLASSQWTYCLKDLQGRSLVSGNLDAGLQAVIDLRSIARGVYLIQLLSSEGEVKNRRLVVR